MTNYDKIEKVLRYIEAHRREQPRLPELAEVAGLSESRLHRLFARWAGTTPKAFLKYLTSLDAKRLLREPKDLLSASLEAGLSGPGRLHDLLVTLEGVTPGEFKTGGEGVEIDYGFSETPLGFALIGATRRGVCHLSFVGPRSSRKAALRELEAEWPRASLRHRPRAAARLVATIFGRSKGKRSKVRVLVSGTSFQRKVWEALIRVPPGRATTYGRVAAEIGLPKASRAVGSAVASNTVAYLIPCHRVIRSAGGFGEYRWGADRKRALLAWEGARRP